MPDSCETLVRIWNIGVSKTDRQRFQSSPSTDSNTGREAIRNLMHKQTGL